MGKQTSLYQAHVALHAKMVDFAGWDMPLHYGSQIQEHHHVRKTAGVFDVSHMTILDFTGPGTADFLRHLLANNIDKLTANKGLYTCMLNEAGGIIDDLIVYKISDHAYRLVVNSGTREKDLAWINQHLSSFATEMMEREDLSMLALQGPLVRERMEKLFTKDITATILALTPFSIAIVHDWMIARTGYTGEDGFEIMLPNKEVQAFWEKILQAEIKPCGLGARDTLRLEAGLNLYGQDMTAEVTPLESNLKWTVAFEPASRQFIGRQALENQTIKQKLVGLILDGQGVLRNHQAILINNEKVGEITSGSFSPTLGHGIALARMTLTDATQCEVDMRGKKVAAKIVRPPFVKKNQST